MRTTLTLESDLAERLEAIARRRGISFKAVVNETIRTGLAKPARRRVDLPSFSMGGAMSGINLDKANELAATIENEAIRQKLLAGK